MRDCFPRGCFAIAKGRLAVVLYDQVPAGIGFSQKLVEECACEDGCPSCVGPAGENGVGGKQETLELLRQLV